MGLPDAALHDVNGDGHLDQILIFAAEDTSELELYGLDGESICLRGVTLDGVRYEGCTPLE